MSKSQAVAMSSELDLVSPSALSSTEKNLLAALLHPSSTVVALIPSDTNKEELLSHLDLCCRAASALDRVRRKIGPVIGRIMLVIYDNPEIYRSLGFEKFPDFVQKYIYERTGLSRSSAYESMKLVKQNPSLTIAKWEELGVDKIRTLSKFTKEGEPSYEKYLAHANQCKTASDFQNYAVEQGLIERGQSHMSAITIEVRRPVKLQWNKFISDARVQSVAGGPDTGLIFESMVQECSSSWQIDGMEIPEEAPPTVGVLLVKCGRCGMNFQVNLPVNISLHDLRQLMYDMHMEVSKKKCDENVSNLIITRPGGVTE